MRSGAALAVIGLGTWLFLMLEGQGPQAVAKGLFGLLTGAATFFCLISGVRYTSDCLSQEKRDGTLGLLFLTDLRGYDIILGKLAATSLNALYGVLAVVPMLAIPMLMGGITGGEFARLSLVSVNTLFWSLAIGIFISSLMTNGRKAAGAAMLLIILIAGCLPALGAWLSYLGKVRGHEIWFYVPSPGYNYGLAFEAFASGPARRLFWYSLGVIHASGWGFLLLASWFAPRTWQDRPAGVQGLKWRDRWHAWTFGSPAGRSAFRKTLLDVNAFYWLSARARLKPALVWAILGLLGAGWLWGLLKYKSDWLDPGMYITTGLILTILIKGWFASECGRQFAEDRQQGAFELLISTPLTVQDFLRGQRLALQRQFLGPVLLVLAIEFIFLTRGRTERWGSSGSDRYVWFWLWACSMVMLLVDLVALYWVGMWQGLTAKNPQRAATGTLARILGVPVIAYGIVILFVVLISVGGGSGPGWAFPLFLWFGLGVGADVIFGNWARQKLLSEFRAAAAQKYSIGAGLLPPPLPVAPRPGVPPAILAQQ
jgi:hypothetical protein